MKTFIITGKFSKHVILPNLSNYCYSRNITITHNGDGLLYFVEYEEVRIGRFRSDAGGFFSRTLHAKCLPFCYGAYSFIKINSLFGSPANYA